jgi:hypothetical protein
MIEEQPPPVVTPPVAEGYTLRIMEPAGVVSSLETRVYATPEGVEEPIRQVQEKLHRNGVREYVLHVVSQATGEVVRTVRRVVDPSAGVVEDTTE